jgi:hypothetical protein
MVLSSPGFCPCCADPCFEPRFSACGVDTCYRWYGASQMLALLAQDHRRLHYLSHTQQNLRQVLWHSLTTMPELLPSAAL